MYYERSSPDTPVLEWVPSGINIKFHSTKKTSCFCAYYFFTEKNFCTVFFKISFR